MGEMILKHYAPSPKQIGLHFEKYDSFIHPPIIKDEIVKLNIYLYTLCFIILGMVYLIKQENKPVTKIRKRIKRKK